MAFGGGGALHATALGKELNARKVIIPPFAGVFSAWGMLMIDLRRDYIQTHRFALTDNSKNAVLSAFEQVIEKAGLDYKNDGIDQSKVKHEMYVDARYSGQEHTVKIHVPSTELEEIEFIRAPWFYLRTELRLMISVVFIFIFVINELIFFE
jgi:N-methylhydantoinase A